VPECQTSGCSIDLNRYIYLSIHPPIYICIQVHTTSKAYLPKTLFLMLRLPGGAGMSNQRLLNRSKSIHISVYPSTYLYMYTGTYYAEGVPANDVSLAAAAAGRCRNAEPALSYLSIYLSSHLSTYACMDISIYHIHGLPAEHVSLAAAAARRCRNVEPAVSRELLDSARLGGFGVNPRAWNHGIQLRGDASYGKGGIRSQYSTAT